VIDKDCTIESDLLRNITISAYDPLNVAMPHTIIISSNKAVELTGLTITGAHGPEGTAISNMGNLILKDVIAKKGSVVEANSSIINDATSSIITIGNCNIE